MCWLPSAPAMGPDRALIGDIELHDAQAGLPVFLLHEVAKAEALLGVRHPAMTWAPRSSHARVQSPAQFRATGPVTTTVPMAGEPDSLFVSLHFDLCRANRPASAKRPLRVRSTEHRFEHGWRAPVCAGGCAHQAEQQQPQILIGKLLAGGRHRELRL